MDRFLRELDGFVEAVSVVIETLENRVALADSIAGLLRNQHAGSMIDAVLDPAAPGAKRHRRSPDQLRMHGGHIPVAIRHDGVPMRGTRQALVVIHDTCVSALPCD